MNKSRYKSKKNILFCDFETNSLDDEKMVYAWLIKDMSETRPYSAVGVSISSFLTNLWDLPFKRKRVLKMMFHNGSTFDFHFIASALATDKRFSQRSFKENKKLINYLQESDYKRLNTVKKRDKVVNGEYELLVDGTSKIFQIVINLEIDGQMKILYLCCAYLTFSYPLAVLGDVLSNSAYKLKKGEIEHKNRFYEDVDSLKADEKVYFYLERDVDILKYFWLEYTKYISYQDQEITAASTAWWNWLKLSQTDLEDIHQSIHGQKFTYGYVKQKKGGSLKKFFWFDSKRAISPKHHLKKLVGQLFPSLKPEDDAYLRKWYAGGITTLNWSKMGLVQNQVNYYDINSAYPFAMMSQMFPIGKPARGSKKGHDFQLIKVELVTDCLVKDTHLPFVFLKSEKGSKFYLKKLPKGEVIYLTSLEFSQFKKSYIGKFIHEVKYSFKCVSGKKLFGAYINYWYSIKKEKKNPILVLVAKLMLNSLYGKFGSKTIKEAKILNPGLVKNWDSKKLSMTKWEHEVGIFESSFYLPIGIKITSDVRMKIVSTVGNNYKNFLYADTDSIAFINDHKIDTGKELGQWKLELGDARMLVAGKKRYILENDQQKKIAFASYKLKKLKDEITFETFVWGLKDIPHLHKKEVKHGVILKDGVKEIKEIWSSDYERSPDCWFQNKQEYYSKRPQKDLF